MHQEFSGRFQRGLPYEQLDSLLDIYVKQTLHTCSCPGEEQRSLALCFLKRREEGEMASLNGAGVAVVTLALSATACTEPGGRSDRVDTCSMPGTSSCVPLAGEILVSAAASLTDAFAALESAFETVHPDVDVVLNLGGSAALRAQILEGAPVDVFASANAMNMTRVVQAGHVVGTVRRFATNHLQIAVPAGNPAGVEGLEDLTNVTLRVALCAGEVPCGESARRAFARAGLVPALDTNEPHVRALLTKIELGELDAGVTYATDVASANGAVEGVDIPDDLNITTEYLIAALAGASTSNGAEEFVRFVLSDRGQLLLANHGFGPP